MNVFASCAWAALLLVVVAFCEGCGRGAPRPSAGPAGSHKEPATPSAPTAPDAPVESKGDTLAAEDALGPQPGTLVFACDFEREEERSAWSEAPFARWAAEGTDGSTCLVVETPADAKPGHHKITMPFDLTPYRGMRLHFECRARAEGVTKPPKPWNGVKYMLHFKSPSRGPHWNNQGDVYGTFDWRTLRFASRIAPDATGGELVLGLESCVGKVWLDDLKVVVANRRPPRRPDPDPNAPPPYRGHDLPRLRGVMSPQSLKDEDLRFLGLEWKANVIRWQITRYWGKAGTDRDLAEYDRWIGGELDDVDKALDACARHGILLVIDLHSPPGGRLDDKSMAMFHEKVYADHFVAVWRKIATRFKGRAGLWGYDLVNEPVQGAPPPEGVEDYLGLQVRAARAIREIDPTATIFVTTDEWGSPHTFRALEPVDVPNVVYQVHMYLPHKFTHQGVHGSERGITYPGTIDGKPTDKETLRGYLEPVREFQLAYNVHIYVGEFSAARWAPGAASYLSDCIDIFEEYGWDWSYHAYREWDGWSLEHGPDPDDHARTATPSDRAKVVLGWFARNRKP